MLEHPLQRFFHSMRAKRPFDWVRFQRRDLLLIDHPLCQAVFSRQGAQLLHFRPQGERSMLWCSSQWPALSTAPIRGGIPVCWPWFGSHPSEPDWPPHGWARQREWRLLDAHADESLVQVSWQLDIEDWHVRLDARLGRELEMELSSYHEDDSDCLFSFALQPYWRIGSLRRSVVHGMELEGGQRPTAPLPNTWTPRGAVKQVLYNTGALVLEDAGWQRRLRIDKNAAAGSVIWHPGSRAVEQVEPGEADRFLCIGAAGYRPGGLILAQGERMRLRLKAGLV
ncbi:MULTISPECIES: D-hexose-6-phosphate mutarotase [Pseudomonas]|jgi:glucose-6-phosphate 1-epimerase|uniref:D-hexose-6-phosphate mutarotase n=1 Tax=Pseudomonas TaxID=286 RepID=UPI0007309E9F|nr:MULTISPECIES: D-hexose-6-phosphate mutarotase [Pseudomonas]KSW26737.1 aldose epimerase [Pseudomonas sp. ADP]MCP1642739.1 glucose-6-phosphate 1-epimerase [Pseudomonas citronellolis]MCP1665663.1 glucose-6-phosphate 1-epimerase [Pseudomonas citronellolis]MCP1696573.1 glucose-6-phosphate 1-epimerase [Pseudomonas citronellolis]MCP1703219.1 glucose-6-phosphate 1-epimerase [Pseudomonas citronellolis]